MSTLDSRAHLKKLVCEEIFVIRETYRAETRKTTCSQLTAPPSRWRVETRIGKEGEGESARVC